MKLLLGIYSKKTTPETDYFSAMLEDFALHGKRKIQSNIFGKLILTSYNPTEVEHEPIAVSICTKKKMFLGGHIYNLEKLISKFSLSNSPGLNELPDFFLNNHHKFLSSTQGNFTLVYINVASNELIIANDTFGLYPLFIYEDEDYLIFSNEFEPITKYKNFDNSLDHDAIAEYFTLGSPLAGKTFFKRIKNLPSACILKVNSMESTKEIYETPNIAINSSGSTDFFAEQIVSVFHEGVQMRAGIQGKKSCMLTGGLDTRFIVSNLSKQQRSEMDFVTFITPGLEPDMDKDVIIAQMIAEKLNLNHNIIEYRPWSVQWKEEFNLHFFDIWRERYQNLAFAGVYGGEFLSDVCFKLIPQKAIFQPFRKSHFLDIIMKRGRSSAPQTILNKGFLKNAMNPLETLSLEINKINTENKVLYFAMEYLTHGFFTQIYGGLSALFANSYTYPTNVLTPFLDKEYLKILLTVPINILNDEKQTLYNTIYKNHLPELIRIPTSNKAFTKTVSNCIQFMEEGKDSKNERVFENSESIKSYLSNDATWEKNFYDKDYILKMAGEKNAKDVGAFFDFESWYLKYAK